MHGGWSHARHFTLQQSASPGLEDVERDGGAREEARHDEEGQGDVPGGCGLVGQAACSCVLLGPLGVLVGEAGAEEVGEDERDGKLGHGERCDGGRSAMTRGVASEERRRSGARRRSETGSHAGPAHPSPGVEDCAAQGALGLVLDGTLEALAAERVTAGSRDGLEQHLVALRATWRGIVPS